MDATARQHAEIARRYAAANRERKPVSIITLRIAELRRLFSARHGKQLPDGDSGRECAFVMAHHIARCPDPERRIRSWLSLWSPWMISVEVDQIVERVTAKPLRWTADKLAVRLGVTAAERQNLGITTVGACDMIKAERVDRRRRRDKARKDARRRAAGAQSRVDYEGNSASRTKPWERLGMSRASWYRAGRPNP